MRRALVAAAFGLVLAAWVMARAATMDAVVRGHVPGLGPDGGPLSGQTLASLLDGGALWAAPAEDWLISAYRVTTFSTVSPVWSAPRAGRATQSTLVQSTAGSCANGVSTATDGGGWYLEELVDITASTTLCVTTWLCAGNQSITATCQPDAGTTFAAGDQFGLGFSLEAGCTSLPTCIVATEQGTYP